MKKPGDLASPRNTSALEMRTTETTAIFSLRQIPVATKRASAFFAAIVRIMWF